MVGSTAKTTMLLVNTQEPLGVPPWTLKTICYLARARRFTHIIQALATSSEFVDV